MARLLRQQKSAHKTEDRAIVILDVKTRLLDECIFEENLYGLSDSRKLLQIGMILRDIALDGPETSDPARLEDPHSYAAKTLTLVYRAMGANYYRACAFCVKDRRKSGPDTYHYYRDAKYAYPEKTGWDYDLEILLKEYHIQVVSR